MLLSVDCDVSDISMKALNMRLLMFSLYILTCAIRQASADESRWRRSIPNEIILTEKDKRDIVLHHNDLRRLTGSSNMRFMSWDTELEWIAQEYSKKCNFQHNSERKHSRGWSVGENIYTTSGDMTAVDAIKAIQSWYDEIRYFNNADWTCQYGKKCGHYTQIVWAETFKIGCALTSCSRIQNAGWYGRGSLFICNYATSGNVVGNDGRLLPVYQVGAGCTRCDKYDYCRNHLCANSARDFFGAPGEGYTQGLVQCKCMKLFISVIFLSAVVVALIGTILYRERVRIMVRIGLWRARRKPAHSYRFSNQNTPSVSVINTPRHSVTALHGIHRIGSPSPARSPREAFRRSPRLAVHHKDKQSDTESKLSPPTRAPPIISPPIPLKN